MSTSPKASQNNLEAPTPNTGATTPDNLDNLEKASSHNLTTETPATEYVRPISNKKWYTVCLGIFLAAMLYGLDTTIAADVQGPILQSLGEIEKLAWVGIGFPMGSVAVILLFGWLYQLFEIKYLFIGSILLFEIGSAICGAAPNMNAMIIGRVIAGMGGSGMYMGGLTYNTVFTSEKERPLYNAAIGLMWGIGAVLGPVVGGGFSESSATWRWAFYINLPLMALCAPIYIFLNPKFNGTPDVPNLTKVKQLDWVGIWLNAGVWTLFQVACTFSGSTWEWNEPGPIVLWVFLGVFIVAFALQQYFCTFTSLEKRLMPIQLLKNSRIVLLYIGTACAAAGSAVMIYFIPLFFVFTRGDSAINAAVRLLPFICVLITFVMIGGGSLPAVGRYMPYYIIAGVLMTISGALMYTVDSTTSISAIYGYEVLAAAGIGLSFQIAYSVAVVVVKPEEIMGSIGLINTAQIGSTAIALSIASMIFQNVGYINLRDALAGRGFSEGEIRGALAGAASSILEGGDQEILGLAINSIVETMSNIWVLIIAAGALSVVVGAMMKREKLVLQG